MRNKEINRLIQTLAISSIQSAIMDRYVMVKKNHPSRVDLIAQFEKELSDLLEISVTWREMLDDLIALDLKLNENIVKNYAMEKELTLLKTKVATLEKSNRELFEQL